MNSSNFQKFLIVGATGRTGEQLVNKLLKDNKQVAIVVRNKTNAKKIFKDTYELIEKVIEIELGNSQIKCKLETEGIEELKEALDWCDVLITTVAAGNRGDPQKDDYNSTVELIKLCEISKNKFQGKLFVLISSLYVTRPTRLISYFLNSLVPFVLGWKALAENKLRNSSLNYLIVRPGGLTNQIGNNSSIGIYQGDTVNGKISRENTALGILKAIEDPNINKGKVTIDIIETNSKSKLEIKSTIKEDDENSIITADHFKITRNITVVLYSFVLVIILGIIWRFK
jgi:putative NADH-flavin reductase